MGLSIGISFTLRLLEQKFGNSIRLIPPLKAQTPNPIKITPDNLIKFANKVGRV